MFRLTDGLEHGVAVGLHLAVLSEDMRPAGAVEQYLTAIGVDPLAKDGHVRVLIPPAFYRRPAVPSRAGGAGAARSGPINLT